jgi:hypothetical protein
MTYRAEGAPEDRSVGELFSDLTRDLSALVRQEVTLAKTEMSQKAAKAGKDVGFLLGGAFVAYAGFLVLLAALVIVLANAGLPLWASALIVGLAITFAGGILVKKGLDAFKNEDLAPRETLESLKGMKQGV